MRIMVFNVPAETVGALSILNEFYDEIILNDKSDVSWILVLSKPIVQETENIKVLRFPWIKKSWLHRIVFDNIVAPKLVSKYAVNKVISFQNVTIPHIKESQTLYVHNSLPFVDYKFSFKENRHLWIYQNIISRNIMKSIKRAERVIVQTEWMKQAIIEKTKIENEKVNVLIPEIRFDIKEYFSSDEDSLTTFFYPASEFSYKNHQIIIDACKMLKEKGIKDYRVFVTLAGNENETIASLYKEVADKKLPVNFLGGLTREKVFEWYSKSILLFPSYIETFGLPLLEAKLHKGIIFASKTPFSLEILSGYENAYFFSPFNITELYDLMWGVLSKSINYIEPLEENIQGNDYSWNTLLSDL